MSSDLACSTIVFQGRVQRVGFRATVAQLADSHPSVTGWVRNEPDGTVRCVVEGPRAALDAFVDSILHRMKDNIASHNRCESPATGAFTDFRIST